MNIISPSWEFDQRLAGLADGYVVGVKTNNGESFDMRVDVIDITEDAGWVCIAGPSWDNYSDDDDPGVHRIIPPIDIDTLEVY